MPDFRFDSAVHCRGAVGRGHASTMCVPPTPVKVAQAKAFAASGLMKDDRLNVMRIPGTSMNPIGFAEGPIFLVLAWIYRAQFETKMLGPMFLIYLWKECIPMSVCLHRYFSHKGFKCGRVTQFALYIGGCLASQVSKKRPQLPPRVKTAADDSSRATTDARRAEGSTRAERNAAGVLARHARAAGFPESHSRRGRDPPPRAAAVPTCSTDDTATASDTFFPETPLTDCLIIRTNLYARGWGGPNLDFKNASFPRTREAGRV